MTTSETNDGRAVLAYLAAVLETRRNFAENRRKELTPNLGLSATWPPETAYWVGQADAYNVALRQLAILEREV